MNTAIGEKIERIVGIDIDAIEIGAPVPFHLFDVSGQLLATKGHVFPSKESLARLRGREVAIYIDEQEAHKRQIATCSYAGRVEHLAWTDFQEQANVLLRNPRGPAFRDRVVRLHAGLRSQTLHDPDSALLALFYLSTQEFHLYSATHALLVSVMCSIAARDVLKWPEEDVRTLGLAALTMNIGMTELQDKLTKQGSSLTEEQREIVREHPERAVQMLKAAGVDDQNWLEAVKDHHAAPSLSGVGQPSAGAMARLIQRADIFAAKRSPRVSRAPTPVAMAMKATYFNVAQQADPAGSAIIKAVGVHPPGAFVKLATGEVGVVVRRGANTAMPRVAGIADVNGIAIARPLVRNTADSPYKIAAAVEAKDFKINLNLERLLALVHR